MMEYKGYIGKLEFDNEAGVFHGEVINTRDVITFEGQSVTDLKQAFQDSVNDYLSYCEERNEPPEKPFSGQFVTRVSPELHRQVNLAASISGKSLNAWVAEQLQSAVSRSKLSMELNSLGPPRSSRSTQSRSRGKAHRKVTARRS